MNGSVHKAACFLLAAVLLFLCCGGMTACKREKSDAVITIGVTEQTASTIAPLVERFNATNDLRVTMKLHVYPSEGIKNYYLSHGMDECDLYTFDNAVSANRCADQLASLDREASVNRYMVSIINSLRASDGHLYVIPSDGFYYTQCFNTDLLARNGLEVPTTLGELKTLASRLKANALLSGEPSSASVGGKESVLFALMSVAYPIFLNTVRGANALQGLIDGTVSFTDPTYEEDWREVFGNLQVLYNESFYALSDVDKSASDGIDRFNAGGAYALQNSAETTVSPDLQVRYSPFLGDAGRDACIGSVPALYLAASKSIRDDTEKYEAVSAFIDLFSTREGQVLLHSATGGEQYISYFKDKSEDLPPVIADLQSCVDNGGFFLADSFFNVFGLCVDEIRDFLSNRVSLPAMMRNIDQKLTAEKNSMDTALAIIEQTLPYDADKAHSERTELGAYYAQTIAKVDYVDGVILPSSVLRCSLLKGLLTESWLEVVLADETMVYAEVPAGDFLRIYDAVAAASFPLTAGLTRQNGTVCRENGTALSQDARVYVLMPAAVGSLSATAVIGRTVSLLELLTRYYGTQSTR